MQFRAASPICFAFMTLAVTVCGQDAVPRLVSFGGTVRDAAGRTAGGPQALTFSIYPDRDSRTPLWQETQNVPADEQGRYSVQLGAATANGVPLDLFTSGKPLWLGVHAGGGAPEQDRVLLVAVPYALKAVDADTLGGKPASAFLTRDAVASASGSRAGGEAPAAAIGNSRATIGATATVGGGGTTNYLPRWTNASNLGDSQLYQAGNNIGLGTTTPGGRLQLVTAGSGSKGLIVAGVASQTGNLQEWQDSAGTALSYVKSSGAGYFPAMGIGNIPPQPSSALYVRQDFGSSPPSSVAGITVSPSIEPSASNSDTIYGANLASYISGGTGTGGQVYGTLVQANSSVTSGGTVDTMIGGRFRANNLAAGAANNLYGGWFTAYNQGGGTAASQGGGYFYNSVTAGSHVTNLYGGLILTPTISGGATVSNSYGLFLQNITGATTNYSIYSAGGTNFFAGNTGVGTSTPAAKLEVNGTAKFDGLITFAPGQTFPGAGGGGGTITGVTAGTDLTGGGTSGKVTLNLDTTKVPELAAANTFVDTQHFVPASSVSAIMATGGNGAWGIEATGGASTDYAGAGVAATGGTGAVGGSGLEAYGGDATGSGTAGVGIYARGGQNVDGVLNYAGAFQGAVHVNSYGDVNQPQLTLNQGKTSDYARIRLQVEAETYHWDIAVGGGNQPALNLYRYDAGNVLSLTPGVGPNLMTMSNGAALTAGGVWANASDRNLKTGFQAINSAAVLRDLSAMPISTWSYKSEGDTVRHLGPTAQDFAAAFHLGQDDKHITTLDESGVALAAIQELYRENQEVYRENQELKQRLAVLEARISFRAAPTARSRRHAPHAARSAAAHPHIAF
jgi:hypothetical protein